MSDVVINPNRPRVKGKAINGMPAVYIGAGLCVGYLAETDSYLLARWAEEDQNVDVFIQQKVLDLAKDIIDQRVL